MHQAMGEESGRPVSQHGKAFSRVSCATHVTRHPQIESSRSALTWPKLRYFRGRLRAQGLAGPRGHLPLACHIPVLRPTYLLTQPPPCPTLSAKVEHSSPAIEGPGCTGKPDEAAFPSLVGISDACGRGRESQQSPGLAKLGMTERKAKESG